MSNRLVALSGKPEVEPVSHAAPAPGPFIVVCPGMPVGIPSPQGWQAVYRLAFEQARLALAPSRFQRMLDPSTN